MHWQLSCEELIILSLTTPFFSENLSQSTVRGDYLGKTVAYLLNIGILGPIAPLTGLYSSGGLN